MKSIHVAILPAFVEPESLPDAGALVIDVLRASTTIVHALSHGARGVRPCLTPEEASAAAERAAPGTVLKGGERRGRLIPGFDLDNSPFGYSEEVVRGKEIAFTTTNGTKALLACVRARDVYVGAFVNRAAVVRKLGATHDRVVLVCAGTDGLPTAEDVLFAGAVAQDLLATESGWSLVGEQAAMAVDHFNARNRNLQSFREAFLGSRGALNLMELGFHRDLEYAQRENLFPIVPRFDPTSGKILATG